MEVPLLIQWGVPLGALAFGALGYLYFRIEGRRLDRLDGKRG